MDSISRIEQEVNQIRLEIYEETKGLTSEQNRDRLNRLTQTAANKYGFKLVARADEIPYAVPAYPRHNS